MVSALACRIRGRKFESYDNHFPQNQIIIFFISLSFLFIFLNFEVKQCVNIYWKYDNTGFAMKKKPNFFLFFKMANTPHKGKTRHIAWLSSFLFQTQCFLSRWRWPCIWWQILYKRKNERLWFWRHFGRTITLAVFDIPIVSTKSQVLYSFIIKVRMDTPIFYFLIFFW